MMVTSLRQEALRPQPQRLIMNYLYEILPAQSSSAEHLTSSKEGPRLPSELYDSYIVILYVFNLLLY